MSKFEEIISALPSLNKEQAKKLIDNSKLELERKEYFKLLAEINRSCQEEIKEVVQTKKEVSRSSSHKLTEQILLRFSKEEMREINQAFAQELLTSDTSITKSGFIRKIIKIGLRN